MVPVYISPDQSWFGVSMGKRETLWLQPTCNAEPSLHQVHRPRSNAYPREPRANQPADADPDFRRGKLWGLRRSAQFFGVAIDQHLLQTKTVMIFLRNYHLQTKKLSIYLFLRSHLNISKSKPFHVWTCLGIAVECKFCHWDYHIFSGTDGSTNCCIPIS